MIVQCTACQAKFRIADEKLGDKAVKVRCSKCNTVFRAQGPGGAPPDPFAGLSQASPPPQGEATHPGVFIAGIKASRPPDTLEMTRPGVSLSALMASREGQAPGQHAPPPDPFQSLDLGGAPSSPAPHPLASIDLGTASLPPIPPPQAESNPFANLDLAVSPPTGGGATQPADPFANLDFGGPDALASQPSGLELAAPHDPFQAFSAGAPIPPAPPAVEADPFALGAPPASAAPAAAAPPAGVDDFFAAAEPPPPPEAPANDEPDRSLFELPKEPPPSAKAAPAAQAEEALELDLPAKRGEPKRAAVAPSSRIAIQTEQPLGRRIMGGVVNALGVAAVAWVGLVGLATYRSGGHFDRALLRPAVLVKTALGGRGASLLTLSEVTNGLYQTRGSRPLFYVRGDLVNRGGAAAGPMKVKVEILDDDRPLTHAEGWAGKLPSVEKLYAVTDLQSLTALETEASAGAELIPPGQSRPFLVLLLDYPDDLYARTLRVTPEPAGAQARRP